MKALHTEGHAQPCNRATFNVAVYHRKALHTEVNVVASIPSKSVAHIMTLGLA